MAGYSKRSLVEKLGIKEGISVRLINPPKNYLATLGKLPQGTQIKKDSRSPFPFIHSFFTKLADLEQQFPKLKKQLVPDGMLWVSWPKGSSKVPTDLNENVIRDVGLRNGLVDVKVCAVDDIWSGLKFVYRLSDRKD